MVVLQDMHSERQTQDSYVLDERAERIGPQRRHRCGEALVLTGHNHTHTARNLGLSRVGLLKKLDRMGLR
jgi:transcriptional regulator with PAS, ATPase and Fis domain